MHVYRIVGFYVEPLSIEHAYSGEWDGKITYYTGWNDIMFSHSHLYNNSLQHRKYID